VTIATVALGCVCLVAAGIALFGRTHDVGSLPNYVASHKALKVAWVDPAPVRDADVAEVPVSAVSKVARVEAAPEPEAPKSEIIPLPPKRPRHMIAAVIPLPRERPVDNEATASLGLEPREVAAIPSAAVFESQPLAYAATPSTDAFPPKAEPPVIKPHEPHAAKPAPSLVRAKPRPPTIQEKLWGGPVRLASLTPLDTGRTDPSGIPRAPYDRQTAVYVIEDKKVYLPDGQVLEAHSGLGSMMDDPRYVRLRMRGATPPHVYDLTMREALFHGVEAIRMTPIGGEEAIFGRAGILAHTYMLGPNGQSNGCVSFKNYRAFLDAFKQGKISRMAVIARLD
jgi:hypothetical protein